MLQPQCLCNRQIASNSHYAGIVFYSWHKPRLRIVYSQLYLGDVGCQFANQKQGHHRVISEAAGERVYWVQLSADNKIDGLVQAQWQFQYLREQFFLFGGAGRTLNLS